MCGINVVGGGGGREILVINTCYGWGDHYRVTKFRLSLSLILLKVDKLCRRSNLHPVEAEDFRRLAFGLHRKGLIERPFLDDILSTTYPRNYCLLFDKLMREGDGETYGIFKGLLYCGFPGMFFDLQQMEKAVSRSGDAI